MLPDRVFIVDKRLIDENDAQTFRFIQGIHPRTKLEQSYAFDQRSQSIFQLVQWDRIHSSWFIDDQYVLPDGSLYLLTPIHPNFLLLPSLWSMARNRSISLSELVDDSMKNILFDDQVLLDRLQTIGTINIDKKTILLDEEKLFEWLKNRIERLRNYVADDEQAFDLLCEYLPDEIIEKCQEKFQLQGNVRYDLPMGEKSIPVHPIVNSPATVNKTKRSKK